MVETNLNRRQFLLGTGITATTLLAGCTDSNNDNAPKPPGEDSEYDPVEELSQPFLGEYTDEAVVVKVFKDYQCPHCHTFHEDVLPVLLEDYIGEKNVVYEVYDYPIPVSQEWSWLVAMMGRAVQDMDSGSNLKSGEAFWEFHDKALLPAEEVSKEKLISIADEAGVEGQEAYKRAEANVYQPVVLSDKKKGEELGIPGTPGVVVDGEVLEDPLNADAVTSAIDKRLE